MTWKDKLEIGLKEDAPYRKDNLPENEVTGPEVPVGPGRSPVVPQARTDGARPRARQTGTPRRVVPVRAGSRPKE